MRGAPYRKRMVAFRAHDIQLATPGEAAAHAMAKGLIPRRDAEPTGS